MTTYNFRLQFANVDLEDFDVLEALAEIPGVMWSEDPMGVFATATIAAESGVRAVREVVISVCSAVPKAQPLRLDQDLVSITDIADRIGVNRETVRVWASGTAKRKGRFPKPRGCVSGNIKVWGWTDIAEWLDANLALTENDDAVHLRPKDESIANAQLAIWCSATAESPAGILLTWNVSGYRSDDVDPTQRLNPSMNLIGDWRKSNATG